MAIGTTAALIGASVAGSAIQAGSAKKAAKSQAAAAGNQLDLQKAVYEDQKELFAPFVGAGTNALAAIQYELGLGPKPSFGGTAPQITEIPGYADGNVNALGGGVVSGLDRSDRENARLNGTITRPTQPATRYSVNGQVFDTREAAQAYADANPAGGTEYGGFKATPGYDFRVNEGQNAIDRAAALGGGLFSGQTVKDAVRFRDGIAADEYGNFYNRLAGLAGSGQNAAGMQGAAAQNYGNMGSNAFANIGNANAAGAIGAGNAWSNAIGNGIGIMQYQKALNPGAGGVTANIFDKPWASGGFWG